MDFNISFANGGESYNAILDDIERRVVKKKGTEFLDAIGQRGESIAKEYCGQYAPLIGVSHKVEGNIVTIIAESDDITREWETKDGIRTEDVSPLLLAEFGSGVYADNKIGDPRGGRGKMPNAYGHAMENGWSWKIGGRVYHSKGEQPTMPMYRAYSTIVKEFANIARSIFGAK